MIAIKWKARSSEKFTGDLKKFISKVRKIDDINKFLNPPVSVVHNPLLLKNIKEAIKRVMTAIDNKEKIVVFADP